MGSGAVLLATSAVKDAHTITDVSTSDDKNGISPPFQLTYYSIKCISCKLSPIERIWGGAAVCFAAVLLTEAAVAGTRLR